MNIKVYAIRDICTGYMTPTFEINDAVAIRNFEHAVTSVDSVLRSHASDFDLFRIGQYDSDTGRMMPVEMPILLRSGKDVLLDA
uniref:Nonstructural protein n=1 Tax=Dulem virus 106 TaxID=3145583 RepID=A0AAU8B7G6_9VIRU